MGNKMTKNFSHSFSAGSKNIDAKHNSSKSSNAAHDELLEAAFKDNEAQDSFAITDAQDALSEIAAGKSEAIRSDLVSGDNSRDSAPTTGDMDLAERNAFRRVTRDTTIRTEDTTDGYEVEYRKLRLEQVILVGVWTEGTVAELEATLEELAALAETAGAEVLEILYQKRDSPDSGTFIGSGKVQQLKSLVQEYGADTVICDGELNPGQLTALERELDTKVIDRTMLILDIFAQHAKSKEGKAQVSLAQLEYLYTHTRGWGGSLSRQAGGRAGSNGGVGLRGPGETKIETDRRRIRAEMARLRK